MRMHPRNINVGKRWARGVMAKAQCVICGLVVPYQSLMRDWRGTWVCRDCNDEPPSNIRVFTDAQALKHPQPLKETFDPPVQLPFPIWGSTDVVIPDQEFLVIGNDFLVIGDDNLIINTVDFNPLVIGSDTLTINGDPIGL